MAKKEETKKSKLTQEQKRLRAATPAHSHRRNGKKLSISRSAKILYAGNGPAMKAFARVHQEQLTSTSSNSKK